MKEKDLINLLKEKKDIQFTYNNVKRTITFYDDGKSKYYILAQEGADSIGFLTPEDIVISLIEGKTIKEIFESLQDKDIEVFDV